MILRVEDVSKRFGGLQAVKKVSFVVQEGGIVGLIGPNGAGKSTLFDLISGVQPCDGGHVTFKDHEITGWRPYRIAAKGMSRTFQKVRVFPGMSVLENAMVGAFLHAGSASDAGRQAEEALKLVDLYDQRHRSARSLTLVDRKRLEMARALATKPSLLLLDEVMCGLNPREISVAVNLIQRLPEAGVTLIVVEHLLKVMLNLCHRVLVLDYGELIADGTPEEVRRNPAVINAYIGGAVGGHA